MKNLDWRVCSRARLARDARFDGKFFIGVLTTKIYCRTVCRGRTSQEKNVRYFPSPAAAAEAGFRPCLRCHPECSPGTPAWAGTQNTVSRALRLISETGLEEGGVEALAEHLGIGSRHLRRLFLRHLGATPSAVGHTRRLHFAKKLIDETTLPMTQIAFAAGFGSVRRFNAAIRNVYHRTPTQIRSLAQRMSRQPENQYLFHLSFRPPYDWRRMLEFLAARAIPGVEAVEGGSFRRSIFVNGNRGYFEVSPDGSRNTLNVRVQIGDPRSLFFIIERVRAIFDLDADWATIARTLGADPVLTFHIHSHPGLRVPGCWNGFEFAAQAILEEHLGIEKAMTLAGQMVRAFGESFRPTHDLTHLFPTPEALAVANLEGAGLPRAPADAIRLLARSVRDGQIRFEKITDSSAFLARLSEIPEIGEWTMQSVAMRALREPDAFPSADRGLAHTLGLGSSSELEQRSQAWRPWRAYGAIYLWSFASNFGPSGTEARSSNKTPASQNKQSCRATAKRQSDGVWQAGLHPSMARGHVAARRAKISAELGDVAILSLRDKDAKSAGAGARVIDQLSSVVYVNAGAILREVVKNAHGAYLALESEQLEEEKLERAVVISRERHGNGTGRLFIEDNGIGQSFEGLRRKARIRNSHGLGDLKDVARFRDLCSWAFVACSKVVIESTTKGVPSRTRLEINVRRIHEKLSTNTTLGDILNDSECTLFSAQGCDKNDPRTTLEIECDGKAEIVNGHELNRLYELTDPEDETLERMLAESGPLCYAREGGVCRKVHKIYERAQYIPTAIYVDGKNLERRLPSGLTAFRTQDIKVAGRLAAVAWYVEDPKRQGEIKVEAAKHLVGAPGIRLVKNNVPIGPRNIFSDAAKENFLNWFVGEVHVVWDDLRPDASGKDLCPGPARDAVIEELRKLYSSLSDRAARKSQCLRADEPGVSKGGRGSHHKLQLLPGLP